MSDSETRRQIVHMAMGGFALLLRVLSWRQAALCALAAFAFNLLVLPRIGGRSLYRPADTARGFPIGILLYPLAVLLLILAFPRRLDIVAITWALLAYGDGAATLAGRWMRGPRLPWNADKTYAGTAAFVIAGAAAGIVLGLWTRPAVVPQPSLAFVCAAPIAAALAAGLIESMPVRIDDNVSVPLVGAATVWGLSLIAPDAWHASAAVVWQRLPIAVIGNGVAAALGWRAGTVSVAGAVGGAVVGVAVGVFTGLAGWVLLFASFFAATASSRLGLKRKTVLGIAEAHGGRRGPGNAIANCGLAALIGVLVVASPHGDLALLAFAAALTAGASDTVASEVGKAWGRRTRLVTTGAPVRPGTPGAVSLEGTAAGLLAAFVLAALAAGLGVIHGHELWCVVVGATVGSIVESALGATLEAPGILNNDMLNFINTAVAALVALLCAGVLA